MSLGRDPIVAASRIGTQGIHNVISLISDSETDYGLDSDSEDDLFVAGVPERPTQLQQPQPRRQQVDLLDSPSPDPHPAPSSPQEPAIQPAVLLAHRAYEPAYVEAHQVDDTIVLDDEENFLDFAPHNLAYMPPQQQEPVNANLGFQDATMGDYIFDEDFDDGMIAQYLGREYDGEEQPPNRFEVANAPILAPAPEDLVIVESMDECVSSVVALFPGICLEYVSQLYGTKATSSDRLVAYILDKVENGTPWPKSKDGQKIKKRKREVDEDEKAALKYGALDRIVGGSGPNTKGIKGFIRNIFREEFPETPMSFVDATLSQSGFRLFSAYRVLEEAQRTFNPANPPYQKVKKRAGNDFRAEKIPTLLSAIGIPPDRVEVLEELVASRRIRGKADRKREAARREELEEEANTRRAEEEGSMKECGCCCCDYPLNRMVHCNGDYEHWFCRTCALSNAETQIGNSRYELSCMSMDDCMAGFSMEQRSQFLDDTTVVALERNEQEAVLRLAGIENLASCPFCPYAAEYPPIEINKEFECQRPECEKVSCRLCKQESHIPKSCEEHAKENGLSIRREIEEAMTAALIRKCNKCQTPFIKEEGCNKMTCTRNGCRNIQCYVCSKSCGYDHFDDRSRGGKEGNCPLFENAEQRHDQEVKEAERIALAKVRAEHPEYTEEDLRIKVSKDVQKDDEKRKANGPRARIEARMGAIVANRADLVGRLEGLHQLHEIAHRRFIDPPLLPPPQFAGVQYHAPQGHPRPDFGIGVVYDNHNGDDDEVRALLGFPPANQIPPNPNGQSDHVYARPPVFNRAPPNLNAQVPPAVVEAGAAVAPPRNFYREGRAQRMADRVAGNGPRDDVRMKLFNHNEINDANRRNIWPNPPLELPAASQIPGAPRLQPVARMPSVGSIAQNHQLHPDFGNDPQAGQHAVRAAGVAPGQWEQLLELEEKRFQRRQEFLRLRREEEEEEADLSGHLAAAKHPLVQPGVRRAEVPQPAPERIPRMKREKPGFMELA